VSIRSIPPNPAENSPFEGRIPAIGLTTVRCEPLCEAEKGRAPVIDATTTLSAYPARYFAAWSQRDLATALDVIAEVVDWQDPSLPAPITDHDGAAGFFTAAWAGFPDLAFHPVGEPLVDTDGQRVSQEWRMVGTHTGQGFPPGITPTGRAFDVAGTDVWQVGPDSRATAVHAYWDVLGLMAQLGLA
jgi:SnoaL-like domain